MLLSLQQILLCFSFFCLSFSFWVLRKVRWWNSHQEREREKWNFNLAKKFNYQKTARQGGRDRDRKNNASNVKQKKMLPKTQNTCQKQWL